MRTSRSQVTEYWILKDRLPYTLNQSTQARQSNHSSKRNKQVTQHQAQQREEVREKEGTYEVRVKVGTYNHEQQEK
jgi:hypothetical protein